MDRRSFLIRAGSFVLGGFFWNKSTQASSYYNLGAFWKKKAAGGGGGGGSPLPGGAPLDAGPWTIFTWGDNSYGQLGLGDTVSRSSPTQLGSSAVWKTLAGGLTSSFGVQTDGTLWAWGNNAYGNLGTGDSTSYSSPVKVGTATDWAGVLLEGPGSMFAVKTNGTLWSWGGNQLGQLGQGDIISRSSPTQIGTLTNWKQASGTWFNQQIGSGPQGAAAGVKSDGTLWTWGHDVGVGCLGANSTSSARSSPVAITGTNWSLVSGGETYFHAIKSDGTLWSWGSNTAGQLGLSDSVNRSVPAQVGALTDWAHALAGVTTSIGLKSDGSIWVWGSATNGSLGNDQSTVSVSSPIRVGALNSWRRIQRAGYGQNGTTATSAFFALQSDGSLWAWGDNAATDVLSNGQLGLGDAVARSSPTRIGASTSWKNVAGGGPGSQFSGA